MTLSRRMAVRGLLVAVACLGVSRQAYGYIDLAPTLTRVISQAPRIGVMEVAEFDRASNAVTLKEIKALKGNPLDGQVKHTVASGSGVAPRPVLQWAKPGSRAVVFSSANASLVCFGHGWYQVRRSGEAWTLDKDRPDLALAYHGSVPALAEAVEMMLAGKNAVITVVAHGAEDEAASFDLALNRQNLPGMVRLERIKADMSMPATAVGAGANANYFIGTGAVDEADVPHLAERLKSPDAGVRAAAAEDLQALGKKAKLAAGALAAVLNDPSPKVRFEAAAALLRVDPKDTSRVDVLARGLASRDAAERSDAAAAAGMAGAPAGALTDRLAELLKDSNESVRINALLSITLLGPAAAKAAPAVQALLDDPAWQIDAADALGRIGAAARPAMTKLTEMLSSDKYEVRWAAVRGMSQIGGEEAKPAVKFIIENYQKGATEIEGYNSMIYLALIGPHAAEALPTIQSTRIKNPVLPSATTWAINADKYFPWQGGMGGRGGRGGFGGPQGQGGPGAVAQATQPGGGPGGQGAGFGGPGGPGGPGGGPMMMGGPGGGGGGGGPGNIGLLIYSNYVRELGPRLAPTAKLLATKILDGTAGEIPLWGYEILANNPETVLPMLQPKLSADDTVTRERAAVAIGYMGSAGLPAKGPLEAAVGKASHDREKRLLQWALRQVEKD